MSETLTNAVTQYPKGTLVRGRTFDGGYCVEGFVTGPCSKGDGYWWIETVDPNAKPANWRLVRIYEVLRTAEQVAALVTPTQDPKDRGEGEER